MNIHPFIFLRSLIFFSKVLYRSLIHLSLDLVLGFLGLGFFVSSISLPNILNVCNTVMVLFMFFYANSNICMSSGLVSID